MSLINFETQVHPGGFIQGKKITLLTKILRINFPGSNAGIKISQPIAVYVQDQEGEHLLPIKDTTLETMGNIALFTTASIFLIWLLLKTRNNDNNGKQ